MGLSDRNIAQKMVIFVANVRPFVLHLDRPASSWAVDYCDWPLAASNNKTPFNSNMNFFKKFKRKASGIILKRKSGSSYSAWKTANTDAGAAPLQDTTADIADPP